MDLVFGSILVRLIHKRKILYIIKCERRIPLNMYHTDARPRHHIHEAFRAKLWWLTGDIIGLFSQPDQY